MNRLIAWDGGTALGQFRVNLEQLCLNPGALNAIHA